MDFDMDCVDEPLSVPDEPLPLADMLASFREHNMEMTIIKQITKIVKDAKESPEATKE